jgi:hypothetical protein
VAAAAAAAVARPVAAAVAAVAVPAAATAPKKKADVVDPNHAKKSVGDDVVKGVIDGPQKTKQQLPAAAGTGAGAGAAAAAAAIRPTSSAYHAKHDKKDCNKSGSSSKAGRAAETVDQAEVIVRVLAQVVKLANEFKDLNEAAQDGCKRYLASVSALNDAETIAYEEVSAQVRRTREDDTDISRRCDADINRRHLANVDLTVAPIKAALMKDAGAAKELEATLKKTKAS